MGYCVSGRQSIVGHWDFRLPGCFAVEGRWAVESHGRRGLWPVAQRPAGLIIEKPTGEGIDLTLFYPLLLCKPPTVECGVLTLIILKELRNGHSRKQDVDKQDRTI